MSGQNEILRSFGQGCSSLTIPFPHKPFWVNVMLDFERWRSDLVFSSFPPTRCDKSVGQDRIGFRVHLDLDSSVRSDLTLIGHSTLHFNEPLNRGICWSKGEARTGASTRQGRHQNRCLFLVSKGASSGTSAGVVLVFRCWIFVSSRLFAKEKWLYLYLLPIPTSRYLHRFKRIWI